MLTTTKTLTTLSILIGMTAAGCRGPELMLIQKPMSAISAPVTGELTPAPLPNYEPDYSRLPFILPTNSLDNSRNFRAVSIADCERLAAERLVVPLLLAQESHVPDVVISSPKGEILSDTRTDQALLSELRRQAAGDAKNRAVGEALLTFYQLAELEGRYRLLEESLGKLQELRRAGDRAKSEGAKLPSDFFKDLDSQEASLRTLQSQARLGLLGLNVELRRRLGLSADPTERLLPTVSIAISSQELSAEESVTIAWQQRADLIGLRTIYWQLNSSNLECAWDSIGAFTENIKDLGIFGPKRLMLQRLSRRQLEKIGPQLQAAAASEVEIRKKQLWFLITEQERTVADEVRSRIIAGAEQTHQVGLAHWKVRHQLELLADLQQQKKGAFIEIPAELEVLRAKSELIAAVMNWHQTQVRYRQAIGEFGR